MFEINCTWTETVLMLNWIVWNTAVYLYKMDLALNNLQWLICHKTKPINESYGGLEQQNRTWPKLMIYHHFKWILDIPFWLREKKGKKNTTLRVDKRKKERFNMSFNQWFSVEFEKQRVFSEVLLSVLSDF